MPVTVISVTAFLAVLFFPHLGHAAATGPAAEFGSILLGLAILVLGAKLGGILVSRWGQPAVLGELLFGIALANLYPLFAGSAGIEFVRSNTILKFLAEVGVLLLLFDVGLEVDLRAFARVGPSAFLVALIGVVVPFFLGWGTAVWFLPDAPTLVHIFIGATLTATSVGITVRVLKDLGVMTSPEAQTILGAAILDDVLGLIVLAVVVGSITGATDGGGGVSIATISVIVLKAVGFFAATFVAGHVLSHRIVSLAAKSGQHGMLFVIGIALCFTLSYVAELIGLANIIGAFAAGVLLDPYGAGIRTRAEEATLRELLVPLSELFVPLFFVLMGLQVDLSTLVEPSALALGTTLIVAAIIGKLVCGLGVVGPGIRRLAVGIGMIPRGEVGLIFAGIGARVMLEGEPILNENVYSSVVLMALITTIITPMGLRRIFKD
jgi:Kef-type K+ transport system membrane component KefB